MLTQHPSMDGLFWAAENMSPPLPKKNSYIEVLNPSFEEMVNKVIKLNRVIRAQTHTNGGQREDGHPRAEGRGLGRRQLRGVPGPKTPPSGTGRKSVPVVETTGLC